MTRRLTEARNYNQATLSKYFFADETLNKFSEGKMLHI